MAEAKGVDRRNTVGMVQSASGRSALYRVLGWTWGVVVVVVTLEFVLYMTALTLFPHLDTPNCAGANTFCSPDGSVGLTGGAVVVLIGNGVAAFVCVLLAAQIIRRAGKSS